MWVFDLHIYLKCHTSTGVFQTFASKNRLSGFDISATLVENGLSKVSKSPILRKNLFSARFFNKFSLKLLKVYSCISFGCRSKACQIPEKLLAVEVGRGGVRRWWSFCIGNIFSLMLTSLAAACESLFLRMYDAWNLSQLK